MAAIEISRPSFGATGFSGRVGFAVNKILSNIRTWNSIRATQYALNKLSDRELEDIGIARGDINGVVQRQFSE